jgi:hypothetical protein
MTAGKIEERRLLVVTGVCAQSTSLHAGSRCFQVVVDLDDCLG